MGLLRLESQVYIYLKESTFILLIPTLGVYTRRVCT